MELSAVDQLLVALAGPNSEPASRQLMAAGLSEEQVRGAWNTARVSGFVEPTGLGQDRITAKGRARAKELGV